MAAQTKKSNKIAKRASASRRANPVMFEPVAEFDGKAAGRDAELSEEADDSGRKAAPERTAFAAGAEVGGARFSEAAGITKPDWAARMARAKDVFMRACTKSYGQAARELVNGRAARELAS